MIKKTTKRAALKKDITLADSARELGIQTVTDKVIVGTDKDSVVVRFEGGLRAYNKVMHGDNFAELAAEFVSKSPHTRAIVEA
jgi:hypothetical protein